MSTYRSSDAELSYQVRGEGPPLVLLHPFPLNHEFWDAVADRLATRYRLILPDLRAHGDSETGEGPVTMEKLANDLALLCRKHDFARATFAGVSIGGYLLFEFWRRHRQQVGALVLANTRAGAETPEGRSNRHATAERILREGTGEFIQEMLPKLLSPVTLSNRPDLAERARRMMLKMSAQDIAAVQRGLAERPDSIATLKTIAVPTLIISAEDDSIPRTEFELMREYIPNSRLHVLARAGHYAALEQPDEFADLLRGFLSGLPAG